MQTATATTTTTAPADNERDAILAALRAFIAQRPGLDPRNYISGWNDREGRAAYRADSRAITTDRHHAEALLTYVATFRSIDAERLKAAFRDAYSGRLSWDGERLDYCTGQYRPTEYRKAACAVLASAIWNWWRDNITADRAKDHASVWYQRESIGDALRAVARREFGASIARRWFN